jgi:hypothetical protein
MIFSVGVISTPALATADALQYSLNPVRTLQHPFLLGRGPTPKSSATTLETLGLELPDGALLVFPFPAQGTK